MIVSPASGARAGIRVSFHRHLVEEKVLTTS